MTAPHPQTEAEQFQKLREAFPADRILTVDKSYTDKITGRRVEVLLSYVGHADVTDRLLQVDPHWTWEPLSVDANGQPVLDLADEGTIGLWIKLSVAGVTRLGYGSVKRNAKEPIKELIGDALRNAAMRFGVALDLWRKDLGSLDHVETPAMQPSLTPATRPQPQATAKAPAPKPAQPSRAPAGARSTGRTEIMGLTVMAFDWSAVQHELVGGQGKKKDLTWGQLADPSGGNEHYLDWCFQNTEKEAAAGKPATPWMSKAVLAYSKLREAQNGPDRDPLSEMAEALPAYDGPKDDVPF